MAKDEAYRDRFREWLKAKSLTPETLLVASWNDVRPVVETERDQFPALHYFTQLFRTRAIGDFMATQRRILEEASRPIGSDDGQLQRRGDVSRQLLRPGNRLLRAARCERSERDLGRRLGEQLFDVSMRRDSTSR